MLQGDKARSRLWVVTATYTVPDPAKPLLNLGRAVRVDSQADAQNLAELDASLDIDPNA
jgi:hypothetical protein